MNEQFISARPEDTQSIGRVIGERAEPGDVILLNGGLGVGKTCLTQGILRGLGSDELARSPTFTLIAERQGRIPLYHMDLYRIESSEQAQALGIEEYLEGDGLVVIEWADNAPGFFPEDSLDVRFELVSDCARRLRFAAASERFAGMMSALRDLGIGR